MLSKFFIHRPKFALVISLAMTLMGMIALKVLPISEYPQISPTVITVSTMYPGANADVVKKTVAQPIEAKVNGVEDMIYMSSTISSAGTYSLSVTFEVGTDPDIAQVNTQNRVSQALALLPQEVQNLGVIVQAASTDMLGVVNVYSPNGTYDPVFISNYATINIQDPLARVTGMGEANLLGALNYSIRIWLDPIKLAGLNMSSSQVIDAIRAQNVQASLGQIGGPPALDEQVTQLTIVTQVGVLRLPTSAT